MRVAIVYPSFGVVAKVNQPNIKAVADNYGIYPNTSLAYLAAALDEAGHDLIFLDGMASGYSLSDMVKKIKLFKPEIMMFTITTYLYWETLEMIKYFKKNFSAKIIVGGAHLGLYPKETLKNDIIDFGIIGEGEITTVELLSALKNNSELSKISGIVYRKNKKVKINSPRKLNNDLDSLPYPARNFLPMKKYYSFISKYRNYTIMITSRGCTFQCSFCEQRTGNIRYRSPENVVDEMEECQNRYGVREIDIFDPLFTINKKRVIEICKEIQKRKLKLAWSCRSRVDTIDEETLIEMKKSGCYRIYYGIESGDEEILRNIKKNTKISQIKKSINLTKKTGILAFGYFMLGNPGETKKSIIKTIKLAKELPLDYAQFSRSSILPGTAQYEEWMKYYKEDYWNDFVKYGKIKEMKRLNTKLSDKELNFFIKKAYREFYFRPIQIFRILKNIKTVDEFLRYAKAGISMIMN